MAILAEKINSSSELKQNILLTAHTFQNERMTAALRALVSINKGDFYILMKAVDRYHALAPALQTEDTPLYFFKSFFLEEEREDLENFCRLRAASLRSESGLQEEMARSALPSEEVLSMLCTAAFISNQDPQLTFLATLQGSLPDLEAIASVRLQDADLVSRFTRLLTLFPGIQENPVNNLPLIRAALHNQNGPLLEFLLTRLEPPVHDFIDFIEAMPQGFRSIAIPILRRHQDLASRRDEAQAPHSGALSLTFAKVQEDPMKYLKTINENGLPTLIRVEGSDAIDAGGPYKEFIYTLASALQDKKMFSLSPKGIPTLEASKADGIKFYEDLAVFLSNLHKKNGPRSDKLLTGFLFDTCYFEVIRLISLLVQEAPLETLDSDLLLIFARVFFESDDSWESTLTILSGPKDSSEEAKAEFEQAVIALADAFGDVDEEGKTKEEIKRLKIAAGLKDAKSRVLDSIRAAKILYEKASTDFKEAIKASDSAETLCESIQGKEPSAEDLIKMLTLKHIYEEGGERARFFETQVEWIKEKIRSSDKGWRKAFAKSVAGNAMTMRGKKIQIRGLTTDAMIKFQTCFNYIDLTSPSDPELRPTKEVFLQTLDDLIRLSYNTR